MENFILGKILALVGRKLDGYKTKIGGGASILTGIVGIVGIVFPGQGLPQMDIPTAMLFISGGMTALGIGGKLEKQKAAVIAQTEAIVKAAGIENLKPSDG